MKVQNPTSGVKVGEQQLGTQTPLLVSRINTNMNYFKIILNFKKNKYGLNQEIIYVVKLVFIL